MNALEIRNKQRIIAYILVSHTINRHLLAKHKPTHEQADSHAIMTGFEAFYVQDAGQY